MPYVENISKDTVPSRGIQNLTPFQGHFRISASRDLSWRTSEKPQANAWRTLTFPTQTVEPYSWFLDLQEMKRNALEHTEFDTSILRKDKGHCWENEKWEYRKPLLSFTYALGAVPPSPYLNLMPAVGSGSLWSHTFHEPSSDLESWAATQYGRMAPSVSEFSLSNFLGELREGLPRAGTAFLQPRLKGLKALGDDYLNIKFGWEPLLNDLQQMALQMLSASYGLFRPYGATHRRREALVVDTYDRVDIPFQVFSSEGGSVRQAGRPWEDPPDGVWNTADARIRAISSVSRRVKVTRSIEGEFVYIPKAGFDPTKYMDRLETLMNFNITPSVLYNLSPWSWMVDWFADIGGAISSMEAGLSNRVLSTYLYAMETTESSVKSSLAAISARYPTVDTYYGPNDYMQELAYTRKRRVRANPFGFTGSAASPLSGEQSAILGALGLTRLK